MKGVEFKQDETVWRLSQVDMVTNVILSLTARHRKKKKNEMTWIQRRRNGIQRGESFDKETYFEIVLDDNSQKSRVWNTTACHLFRFKGGILKHIQSFTTEFVLIVKEWTNDEEKIRRARGLQALWGDGRVVSVWAWWAKRPWFEFPRMQTEYF